MFAEKLVDVLQVLDDDRRLVLQGDGGVQLPQQQQLTGGRIIVVIHVINTVGFLVCVQSRLQRIRASDGSGGLGCSRPRPRPPRRHCFSLIAVGHIGDLFGLVAAWFFKVGTCDLDDLCFPLSFGL